MKDIKELRAALKPLGYKVKTEMFSWGRHATYIHIESRDELTYNVFPKDRLARWQPLFDWQNEHAKELAELKTNTFIYGLHNKTPIGLIIP